MLKFEISISWKIYVLWRINFKKFYMNITRSMFILPWVIDFGAIFIIAFCVWIFFGDVALIFFKSIHDNLNLYRNVHIISIICIVVLIYWIHKLFCVLMVSFVEGTNIQAHIHMHTRARARARTIFQKIMVKKSKV